jgi:hypothetical protein
MNLEDKMWINIDIVKLNTTKFNLVKHDNINTKIYLYLP